MFDEQDRQYFYNEFKSNGYEVGSYDDFKKDLNNKEDRDWYYNEAKNMGYDVGTQADFDKMVLEPAASASPSTGGKQVVASAHASKPQVAQPKTEYPQEVLDAYNSPDNKPGNFKDLAQLNDEYQRGELKKPGIISQALGMFSNVDAGNVGKEQKVGGMIANMLLGDNMQQPQDHNQQVQQPAQQEASPESKEEVPVTAPTSVVNNEGLMDAKLANYLENWKQRPDKQGTYFENMVADLLADGTANSNEEAVNMVQSALGRYANRSAMDVTNQVVASLPDDTVQDAEKSIEAQWYSHGVQDKLKQEADSMGISYDDYVGQFLKPAMVQSLVNKYGPNYRDIAEGIATRLYSHDEHVQDRLMNQDINEALSDVISKYTSTSVAKAIQDAEAASNAQMAKYNEQSKYVDAASPFAIGAIAEANKTRDPQKILGDLQKKFGKLYRNPEFLNDMSNAAFKVMQRYGLNSTLNGDPKQFKPMINAAIKNELDQLEVKGMIPRGSADYILKTGIENTIIGKVSRKLIQTDYQNWLEDMANQQYQPGFWENVASGALTFAGDAWSYWLPGAAGGKLTKSMIAKAEGKLAGDLMAKGMERKVAERAAKVLIGKSKDVALKNGAVHGAVTFGGQSAISKPIDEIYRTGQLDENGKVYNPSVGKILANTLGEVAKQSAVGAIMQGGTIANMVGKGRGLATNVLADVGGKVVDSSIMTGQQMLERMAHDPNFKPTGKDFAESALESMANLTSIGLPGMVGKYARFKDAKEFNRKFDFNDRDIAELKRFGYDDLRDAFEKLGINGYRADGEGVQMMGQLTDKYMNLMNDKSVPEVLKAKMMAVVEGKRPSSFSPVIDSIIVQPMDNDGKVYLETLNKDGGIIDRKEYSSLEEAQKAEKKLDFEKSLNITSEYEKAYHTDALQDRLNTIYEQARDRYAAGEQLNDEDKAAIYLHQNASAIGDIMQKQQKGMELTEQEQRMVNSYRHFYDSAFENSPIMKEYVRTFEDSQGVEHGTLRKALEGDGKSRTAEQQKLVEEYQKQLYNDIVLKREMNDTKEQMNQNLIEGQRELPGATQEGGASAENAEATAEKPVDASVSSDVPPTEPPTPPVGGETPTNAEGAPLMENGASPSDANTASNESKSNAYVMGQNAYQNGDVEGLKAIDHNDDVSKARLKRAFGDDEAQMNVVVKAYEDGKDMEQFVAQRANSMTTAQQDAVRKYVEAQDAKKGVYDALQHADDGYGDALKELLWTYQTEDGNIVPATLTTGQQVFLKKANEYGGGFVVVPDEDGNPAIKQVSSAEIKEVGTPIPMDDYINQQLAEQVDARYKQFRSQFDGSGFKRGDIVSVSMEAGDEPSDVKIVGYTEDGRVILTDTDVDVNSQIDPNKLEFVTKDEFNAWRQNAIDTSVGAELDAEDAQRANDDAAKAEADKKQRYNEGIVGLGMGQPDYSSKDTEPKVAAEYLQEQFGNDHGKLMNLISGSRSDIKEQLDNKRKAASEYEDWLSLNADLDPEKAQKVENDLALVNEQIADLETRYKNWNAIRKEVMTPEEARTLKNERKAEIEKAGVDDSVGSPSDEREVAVLDNKELKKQYPTMDEASNYIASERKRIYHIQNDEVQPQIDDINEALEQYMNGDIDYSADQLKELNTTKAQLEARQANLSASAKDLKAQDKLLNTLYSAENKEERAKAMEEMTPSEQRKALVAVAFKKNDLGVIKEIYKDASVDVMDLTPQTLEEAVSESLSPHSLNPESLQYELGKSNFKFGIGKRYDSNKFNYLIAKKGTGMSVNEFAVRVFNDLPVNLQDMGYTDQDVRNTLLDMFKSYDNVKDMRNVALMNRIVAAEEELSSEEEYYEAQKEREIIERQAENPDYYAYLEDNSVPLPSENELNHIAGMEYDRMMEIENREREYKQYVKSILPELADYDDRSNEEGYGGGSSLDSDSSRRGVDEGNRNRQEGGSREASAETETGALHNSTGEGRQEISSLASGKGSADRTPHLPQEASFGERLKNAIAETEPNPSEAQKKAGNYKKGHLSFGGYDFTVETPKGATRSGKDEQGKPWSVTMHDTYGYILGKIGVDGDHIDMFINDAADLDSFDGNVYVVDQVNQETGEFDEHKVMYGYPSEEAATEAYLANYSKGWKGLGKVTSVPKTTFDKWLESSDRKTKPFREYAMIQHEEAKKAKKANETLPFDAPMNMDDLPFHRDVKEVKPSDMTEAQKVAYDAVSTMLKKAGIPVKVVSNEDMEKVAEAQDNLNLAMLLNQPEMRFKIKTPEEKQAAENAYNFAKELRPDKWKQYAVVDMNNPSKMPEYFEKQELARKERSYYNKLMWGNYKVFNLDKSFEDNVAGLTGSFPSEFDPYKIDAQTNKRNELKKQIKETEEAYKLTGQERKEYQNQLMKEYMDEHGLASENDIPDDVWREFDYKAIEKYQDKLDSLFAKYKDLDRQLKAVAEPGVQYLKGKGVVYGYTDGKEIVLNQEHLNANTPIHEYQHLWRTAAKKMNPELIEHGDKLIMQTRLFADLKEDPNYKHLSDDEICDEAFARLTGEDGASILEQMAKDAIKENPLDTAKELTIINRLKNWLKKFWYWTLDTFTKWKPEDIKKMTLEDIRNLVLRDLAESRVLWNRFRGDSNSLGENQGSALTPSANNPSGKDSVLNPHSDAKIRNSFEITKENGGNLSVEDKIKAVSQQFGVDEADVAMYANAVKKGSTAEAARARANIKRHLLQANEDKISSFKELLKYTKPVNEALKENFGDVDAMIEERKQQMEAQRNAMEAARKRAEEEEAKRKKHLEELSLIPDDKLDKQYMDALSKGDDATAREMLDEAARRQGYDDTESAYQGVGAWAAPGNPGYESDKARRDDWESSGSDVNLEDMALGYTPQPDDYFSHPERYSQNTPHGLESVKAINTAIDAIKNGEKDVKVKVYRAVPTSVKEGKLRNGDWVTPSKKYAEMHGTNRLEGKYRIIEDEVPATQLWWDGNDANEFGFDDGKEYKYKNAKNNRKLNDLVTYDDEGDVIPPSKRFNSRKSDIRFMFAGEKGAAEADKADEQTIRMDNLDVAKQMEEAKKDAKAIKMATGWERGADGKWRYEMPDAKIKDMKDIGGGNIVKRFDDDMLWNGGKLADAIDAPGLFEAYPQLKDVRIDTDAIMNDMPSNGEYNAKTNTITIHADELKYMNSILNHEIQHAIQHIEGFAKGGSPRLVRGEVKKKFNEVTKQIRQLRAEGKEDEAKALVEKNRGLYHAYQRNDDYNSYKSLAGEAEARNVEARMGMTDEERRNSLASETEDVNRDEQIVMNGNDASYSIVKDPETIKKLDKEDTVKVYRAMQVGEDGKLYPPMAAKVKGKFVEPIELGKWEQADERPELADDKGMFTLNKGNGKSLKAAYNPYLHTSRTPLNDQFSEAQNRPNIVTVEVEVPKSELTSGYKADKAKDAVGEVEWKAGIIQGQLTGKRKVVLSRWDKPVRIVPDSEVADVIVNDMFKGKNITMPTNVVTPSLRKELEKRGVPFVETDNRGRIVGGENDGVHYSKVYGKNHREKGYRSILKFSLGDNGTDVADGNGDSINKNSNKNVITRRIGSREQAQRRVNETLGAAADNFRRNQTATAEKQQGTWDRGPVLGYVIRAAKRNLSFIPDEELKKIVGESIGHGEENFVYHAKYDDTKVIKLNDFTMTDSLFRINEFIDRINAHNQFMPKDKYTPLGFAYNQKGDPCIVMEQPYLKGTTPTREEITQYLTDHGFKLDMIQISADEVDLGWTNGEFDLWDAEPRNVIKDENGDLHFFDTMIQHTNIPNHKNPLRLSMPSIRTFESQEMKDSADKVKNVANVLGGAEVTSYTNASEVPDEYKEAVEQGARGWYDPSTHTVHVYLPNCADADEAQRTVFHEKIGHEGMEVLLGGEHGVRKFADFVYKSVGKETRGKILDFANKYDPGWNNPDRINIGTQEYIAHLAEEGPTTAEDFSLWTKIKHYLIKVLKKLGIRVSGLLNDKDLRYYLMKAGKALHVWDNMPKTQQEAMMAQASNAEIKDALSDGAGKGKPRQKKGESAIQYMKRVMEWKRWKEAREDKEDPEPPMFYDFDKDAEGKKEWERLNKEWRESHGLRGEEMPLRPERKEGESDESFLNRYKEWEKWNDAMGDKENPMPDMFSFEKQKQDEARQKYEDWLTRHELNEQNDADLDLYEGKVYPAETNPEADALEQRVMQDLAEVTSTDVSKEGAATTVKHAVIHRRKNMEEASADDAIYINDVKNSIEKMAESGAFDKLLSDYQGKPNKAEKLAEAIPYIIEAPRRLRDLAHDLNATGAFDKGHIHIQPADVEAIQPFVADLIAETGKKHTELKDGKKVEVYDEPQAVGEVASKMAQAINANHRGEEGFVPIDGTDILSEHVLPLVTQQIVPEGIDYKNLSPEMKATLDSIRDWYNYTYDWLKDNRTLREDTGYNVDYVNHIWDKEKSDKNAYAMYVENRQRTKSPNEKPRTISTLMEGVSVGLVPKTTDITKMMAYYSRSNIEAWANKTMLQEVSGLNVIERNEDGEIISSDPLLSSVAPFNLEQYKYFEIPGVGPVWVYNESPKEVKVKNPITGKENVLYREASAGDRFGVVFETYQSSPFWKAFDTAASSAKKLELGFSGFHAGALTEVYAVQNGIEFGPKKAMAYFMKYIFVDTLKNHQLPCFANPEDFQEAASHGVKFGATNDYAAADVQNMFDNFRDFAQKLQKKLEERGNIGTAAAAATIPFEIATQMVSMLNKGMDVALWDFIHDGLKLATYRLRADRTKERAKKYGWTDEQLSKALDEDGQFVNDMFGGQHWDMLGVSHRTLRYAGRVLLSPDWNVSTTRHFLAITGFGSLWNEATFENFKEYYKHLWGAAGNKVYEGLKLDKHHKAKIKAKAEKKANDGAYTDEQLSELLGRYNRFVDAKRAKKELSPEDWGRFARQLSAFLCLGIGYLIFYEGFANAFNAAFRALDEEKERKKAEEIRKTNPNYRSPYELAYPDGMKWYDYLMRGNSLGQQSKIFMGRYADGTEMYIRHGKQFREVPEYLFNHKGELEFPGPMVQRMIGKANPMVRMTLDDINYLSDFQASHADQEIQRKYGKTIGLLYKDALYWAPFLIPSQENKEFKAVDIFFPSSKGFSPWKAQSYFKDFILSGDMEGIVMTYQSCERNGIDPEEQIKAAIGSVKALEASEMQDGVTSLQVASERFDEAKSITEKKKMRQKMKKFLSQSEYKAFTQKEALDMVQGYLNGDEDLKEMEKAESKYLMKAKAEDVTEDWRIQNVWNGTMETYQEYQRLKDVDKAKANAFKNSKTNKRLLAARKAISAAKKKMNKAKKQMDGQNDAAKMVEIRKTRKELIETLNGME